MRDWDPEKAMSALQEEAVAFGYVDPADGAIDAVPFARRQFKQSLNRVIAGIEQLALFGETEAIRLQASKYWIDRCMGVIGPDGDLHDSGEDPLEKLLGEVTVFVDEQGS